MRVAFGDQHSHFLFGHHIAGMGLTAQKAQHEPTRRIEQPYRRRADPRQKIDGRSHKGCHTFRCPERKLFGHKLTYNEREVGDGDHH